MFELLTRTVSQGLQAFLPIAFALTWFRRAGAADPMTGLRHGDRGGRAGHARRHLRLPAKQTGSRRGKRRWPASRCCWRCGSSAASDRTRRCRRPAARRAAARRFDSRSPRAPPSSSCGRRWRSALALECGDRAARAGPAARNHRGPRALRSRRAASGSPSGNACRMPRSERGRACSPSSSPRRPR